VTTTTTCSRGRRRCRRSRLWVRGGDRGGDGGGDGRGG